MGLFRRLQSISLVVKIISGRDGVVLDIKLDLKAFIRPIAVRLCVYTKR